MDKFSDWLRSELKNKDWLQADLHRRSGMSKTAISDVLAEKYPPGWEFCASNAKAFQIPTEVVIRKAGLLSPAPPHTEKDDLLLHYFHQLSIEKRKDILLIAKTFIQE